MLLKKLLEILIRKKKIKISGIAENSKKVKGYIFLQLKAESNSEKFIGR